MHPLFPLTPNDIEVTVEVLTRAELLTSDMRIPRLTMIEPHKDELRRFEAEGTGGPPRRTHAYCFDVRTKEVYEAIVSVTDGELERWEQRHAVGPGVIEEERVLMEAVIKRDPRWVDAIKRRGIGDLDLIHFEFAPAQLFSEDGSDKPRIMRAVAFVVEFPNDNYYAHPVDGLVAVFDLRSNEVVEIEESDIPIPIPTESGNFDPASIGSARTDIKPLDITQPDGPSFTIEENLLRWAGWQLRVGFTPVEGLVLHQIGFRDQGELRPILFRAALGEMIVPYGDSSITQWWRAVFDAGEVGLGLHATSLELGCDCLGEIRYLDAVVADPMGTPRTIRNAICIHEEDVGVAWKHNGVHVGTSEVRRNRRLVISFFATVGNYDYGFFWHFYPDGSIEAEIRLTGIIYTGAVDDGVVPQHGTLVAPNLYGPHHQHLFCYRLDFELDGTCNSVEEVDTRLMDLGPGNPHGNAFVAHSTRLSSELQAQRLSDPATSRYWKIVNEGRRNRMGQPVAYKLVPQYSPTLLASPDSYVGRSATFASKHLWVTPFEEAERYPSGDHPVFGSEGLALWTAADRSIEDTDVVLWHTVGTTHVVRPEDWPVMPVERIGFTLKPVGFFDRNPALDLPQPTGHGGCATQGWHCSDHDA